MGSGEGVERISSLLIESQRVWHEKDFPTLVSDYTKMVRYMDNLQWAKEFMDNYERRQSNLRRYRKEVPA